MHDSERHKTHRVGWLRAAVLGANDGIVSTASLLVGVAAAEGGAREMLVAGAAGLVAGAMSMAAGEYVSVSSQADAERADLRREHTELAREPEAELRELASIYVGRGLEPALAREVAEALTRHDALAAHARDELGLSEASAARPVQAALTSAAAFACGAGTPLAVLAFGPAEGGAGAVPAIALVSLALLGALGALGAKVGGAPTGRAALRVLVWSSLAMAATAGVGALFRGLS